MKYFATFEKKLREYFSCNEILEIFLTCFYNILCHVEYVSGGRNSLV